jgi:hypothetical protein
MRCTLQKRRMGWLVFRLRSNDYGVLAAHVMSPTGPVVQVHCLRHSSTLALTVAICSGIERTTCEYICSSIAHWSALFGPAVTP